MSKKKAIILVLGVSILLGVIIAGVFFLKKTKKEVSKDSGVSEKVSEERADLLSYEDASGFRFQYPNTLEVSDITPEDNKYYSVLELVKGDGSLKISLFDTSELNLESFIKGSPEFSKGTLIGATVLGGVPAKQYQVEDKLKTVAYDLGVIYLIEGDNDGDFWEEVQNTIVSSFFVGEKETTSGSGENIIYEEEEIIE